MPLDLGAPAAGVRFEGYASRFGVADLAGDIVRPGAFAKAIAAGPARVRMLLQHDPSEPIGVWTSLNEDARGLFVRGQIFGDGARAQAAARLVALGALDGLSIGFRALRAARRGDGVRELFDVDLWEVSLVTFPMAPQARVTRVFDPHMGPAAG